MAAGDSSSQRHRAVTIAPLGVPVPIRRSAPSQVLSATLACAPGPRIEEISMHQDRLLTENPNAGARGRLVRLAATCVAVTSLLTVASSLTRSNASMRGSSTHPRPAAAAEQVHEKVLYSFRNGSDGGGPNGNLLMDKSGALYGTTWMGGAYGYGAVFKLTPSGSGYKESVIYSPSSFANANPNGGLTVDENGALYGGGWNGDIFKLT